MDIDQLEHCFCKIWPRAGTFDSSLLVFRSIRSNYSEPHRRYHTLVHIAELLTLFDDYHPYLQNPLAVELAIWFHDFYYDTTAQNNEARSAHIAKKSLEHTGCDAQLIDRVCDLINMTALHADDGSIDAKLFIDMDMSILGSSPRRYQQYASQVRSEYLQPWLAEKGYNEGRKKFLSSLLRTKYQDPNRMLFLTDLFEDRFGEQAEENIAWELRDITSRLM